MAKRSGQWRLPIHDRLFHSTIIGFTCAYVGFIVLLVIASTLHVTWEDLLSAIQSAEIQSSLRLTFLTCSFSSALALIVAIPTAYLLSRYRFRGRSLLNTIIDIPIMLPPLVVGLSLLILFNTFPSPETSIENWLNQHGLQVTFDVAAIILAQFTISAAFAIRNLKSTFDLIPNRFEQIALTLGCSQSQAFWRVALPLAQRGILAAGIVAWARALGEFGPILIFAGATRGKTEVLSSSVYLELNTGNLAASAAISLLLITLAVASILTIRTLGERN
ncbi:ABC transporter permease [Rubritalea marina]|uniref:ABC transporter permease n=1 Tax=Rubritalea marina TaxID=361055 RepID=UPI00035D370C|nr:ABC transporter permease [Rubritalea marina]